MPTSLTSRIVVKFPCRLETDTKSSRTLVSSNTLPFDDKGILFVQPLASLTESLDSKSTSTQMSCTMERRDGVHQTTIRSDDLP
jgi:hypothetical protein